MVKIKSYTDLNQSKVLSKILSDESADMYWWYNGQKYYVETIEHNDFQKRDIHCWSLAALLSVLPHIQEFYPTIAKINDKYVCRYAGSGIWTNGDNPVDVCYEMILKLNELKML